MPQILKSQKEINLINITSDISLSRQTNKASSPKTTRLQRPQSPGGLFYIWFDPKLPVFHLQSIKFPTFSVTKKSDGTYLKAKMVARIEVRNPNEKIIYHFGESKVETTTGDEEVNLGSTSLPKFTQEKGNATSLKTVTKVNNELIEDRIGSKILHQFKSKKLKVKMNVKTRVGIGAAGMKTGLLGAEVFCGGVTLKETESGEMPRCVMKILQW
ncbi:hypothetical protein POTOM_046648 [Populus tomentosa]|uniref:Late embryogenesis abundant protein LEA-2 subgroup domain-containing protein n=1 Tax=Populus tomentosa TaxID=118781 RepID=A0A8X7YR09_POPTO|nr:hypothetical protein POTOM_046648 [Populus tomentosa]